MKSSSYLFIALLLLSFTSCTDQKNPENYSGQKDQNAPVNSNFDEGEQNSMHAHSTPPVVKSLPQVQEETKIVMHPIMDPKTNQPSSYMPLPANWKIQTNIPKNGPVIKGPNGIEVYYYPYQVFMFSNDPYTQQAYQAAGQQMRRPQGIENVLNQDVAQMAQRLGLKFIKQYPLPQVAQANRNYSNQLYTTGQQQTTFLAAGSDWEGTDGQKVALITHYNENAGYGSVFWGYYVQMVKSGSGDFENAKNAFINGLVNTQYNQQNIAAYNQAEAAKESQSWASHNQKMQNNQAAFDAQQRAHQSTVDAWNKSSMDAYNSRSASQDRMHKQTIDQINETQIITDPSTGQQYQVEGYAGQYWINSQGEYIRSDNSLFNPNLDPNYNDQRWEEAPVSPR